MKDKNVAESTTMNLNRGKNTEFDILSRDNIYLLDEKIIKNNNIICRTVDYDIHVLFNPNFLDRSISFILNEIGFFVWNSLDGKSTGSDIADKIKKYFNIEHSILSKDINNFIFDLKTNLLISNNNISDNKNIIFNFKNADYLAPILRIIDMEPLLSIGNESGNNRNCGICGGGCYSITTAYSYY